MRPVKLKILCRFSLRTLLVTITIFAMFFGYHLHWLTERHKVLNSVGEEVRMETLRYPTEAPGLLRYFGETGQSWVYVPCQTDADWERERPRVECLFPEALVERLPKYYMSLGDD